MANLSVTYMGMQLKSPVIVGSSGLSNSIANLKKMEAAGAGAIVLKSIFEEQIHLESNNLMNSSKDGMDAWNQTFKQIVAENPYAYAEALSYISGYARENTLQEYLQFVTEAKQAVNIPVIASINCISPFHWTDFAKRIQQAGADAIELNIFILPSDFQKKSVEIENVYISIIKEVQKFVSIPISLKIGYYFTSLSREILTISKSGINGIVLFNRPFTPDIDIEKIELSNKSMFSNNDEYLTTLRWVGLLSEYLGCDIVASTGIHNSETIVKQLLVGASAVQVASTLYKNGIEYITELNKGLSSWMDKHNFATIDQFRGKLSKTNIEQPAAYERVQFMKHFAEIE